VLEARHEARRDPLWLAAHLLEPRRELAKERPEGSPGQVKPADGPERTAEILARDGCAIVDRAVEPEVLQRVSEEMRPWLEATRLGGDVFSGHRTRRTGALTARRIVTDPLVLGTVGRARQRRIGRGGGRRRAARPTLGAHPQEDPP
jgi:hypothetical protein